MAMTYAKKVNLLSESVHKVSGESDLDKKALAAKELLSQARDLGAHIGRFARTAWILTMLFFFFALMTFCGVVCFELFEGILPQEVCRIIEPIYQSDGFSDEIKAWLDCILVLLAVPVVIDVFLAVVCRLASVTAEKAAGGAQAQTCGEPDDFSEKLSRLETTLNDVQNELSPARTIAFGSGVLLCLVSMIPITISIIQACAEHNISGIGSLIMTVIAGAILFALVLGALLVLLCLELFVLTVCFSSWKSDRQIKKMCNDFTKNLPEYKRQCAEEALRREAEALERQRLADLAEGAELYKRAVQGKSVDENLMILAAEKGDPRANLHIGEQILMLVNDSGLTDREIAEFYEDARDYFKVAADAGIPDGIFWHAAAQLLTEAHSEDGWMEILRRVRALDKSKLSEACVNVYDTVIKQLVGAVNSAAALADARKRKQQAEDAALMEEIMRRPCKYSNGTICTRKSTPSFPHFCNGDGTGRNFCVEYAK